MKKALRWGGLAILASLILVTVAQLGSRIFHAPLEFDESYNLQVPQHLAQSGRYATNDTLLDINITTGPTVLMPAALAYPVHPLAPRVIVVVYALIFLAFALTKFFRTTGERILFLGLINMTPLYFLFSTQIVGEVPGFVLLFFSYILFARSKYLLAGLLLGLSILTKSIFVFGAVPIVLYILHGAYHHKKQRRPTKQLLYFILAAAAPFAIWELYKLVQFGFDFEKYRTYSDQIHLFSQTKGAVELDLLERRLDMFGYVFPIGGFLYIFLTLFISGFTYLKTKQTEVKLLSVFTAVHLLYFVFLGTTDWYRHLFPSVLALTLIIPVFISHFIKDMTLERKIIIGALAIIAILIPFHEKHRDQNQLFIKKLTRQNVLFLDQTNKPYRRKKLMLEDQYAIAEFIKQNIKENDTIAGFGWLNSPEIAYLTNRTIHRVPQDPDVQYVISSLYDKTLNPSSIKERQQMNLKLVYGNSTYEMFQKLPKK